MIETQCLQRLNTANKIYVSSSPKILYIDYSSKLKKLEVEKMSGEILHYLDVDPPVWEELRETVDKNGLPGLFLCYHVQPHFKRQLISRGDD